MSGTIHVGDIGTVIEVTVKDENDVIINLSTATVKQFIFDKPDGVNVTKTAIFSTDGVDGKLRYVTIADDMVEGDWNLQVYIENPSGKWHSDVKTFSVRENL